MVFDVCWRAMIFPRHPVYFLRQPPSNDIDLGVHTKASVAPDVFSFFFVFTH